MSQQKLLQQGNGRQIPTPQSSLLTAEGSLRASAVLVTSRSQSNSRTSFFVMLWRWGFRAWGFLIGRVQHPDSSQRQGVEEDVSEKGSSAGSNHLVASIQRAHIPCLTVGLRASVWVLARYCKIIPDAPKVAVNLAAAHMIVFNNERPHVQDLKHSCRCCKQNF